MSVKQFCDVCKKELTRNMVLSPLVVENGGFKVEVVVSQEGTMTLGDLCYDCLIKMLVAKPKRKYVRKPTAPPAQPPAPPVAALVLPPITANTSEQVALPVKKRPPKVEPGGKPDISTFAVRVGQNGEVHTLSIGDTAVADTELKRAVEHLLLATNLTLKDVEEAEESEGKRLLLGILEGKEERKGKNG